MPTPRLTNDLITAAIEGFEAQKKRLEGQIAELRGILAGGITETAAPPQDTRRKRGKFSAATRLKMKEAQQRRWAKIRGKSEKPTPATVPVKPKRQLSEAGRQAIAEATRKRWAAKKAAGQMPAPPAQRTASRTKAAQKTAAPKKAAARGLT